MMLKQKIARTLTGAIGAVMMSTTVHAVLSKNHAARIAHSVAKLLPKRITEGPGRVLATVVEAAGLVVVQQPPLWCQSLKF
jgi:hypothetical protein